MDVYKGDDVSITIIPDVSIVGAQEIEAKLYNPHIDQVDLVKLMSTGGIVIIEPLKFRINLDSTETELLNHRYFVQVRVTDSSGDIATFELEEGKRYIEIKETH
jgi:hypothetical protein